MSRLTTARSTGPLALALVLALLAALTTIGVNPASARGATYATVTGHEAFSSEANKVNYWCPEGGSKLESPGGSSYVLTADYALVIVKAGSGQFANTEFAGPTAGQTVWADTNGDSQYNPGGQDGDKEISHIILCDGTPEGPKPGSIEAVKEWKVTGVDGNPAGTPGTLTFNAETKDWNTAYEYPAGTEVTVAEAGDGTAPKVEGYTCTLDTTKTTYQVDAGDPSTTTPTVTITTDTLVTVTITNVANCTMTPTTTPPATTALTVTKTWDYVGAPDGYTLTAEDAGALTVTVDGVSTGQAWGATQSGLKVGDKALVTEGTIPPVPQPGLEGYTCEVSGLPEYAVNGGAFSTTAAQFPLTPSSNDVVVRNTVTCEVVGGVEEGETPGETPEDGIVSGTEDEDLAHTGANVGPAGLGLLLVLSGAALIGARRFAIR